MTQSILRSISFSVISLFAFSQLANAQTAVAPAFYEGAVLTVGVANASCATFALVGVTGTFAIAKSNPGYKELYTALNLSLLTGKKVRIYPAAAPVTGCTSVPAIGRIYLRR